MLPNPDSYYILTYILATWGEAFFPFISSGGSNLLISYAFLGIVMSIYKYKAAYPQHVDIDIRGRIRLGKIEITKS